MSTPLASHEVVAGWSVGRGPVAAVAGRAAGLLAVALLLAQVHLPGRPGTLCLLRGLTGVPCPFCGGTTAAVRVGHGDLAGALRASPLAVLGAPVVAGLPVLRPVLERVPRRVRLVALVLVLAAAETWQLIRMGLV